MLDALLRDRTLAAPELRGMLAFGDLLVFTASAEASQGAQAADDPEMPSPLLSATMPVDPG